jgi:hypothetical protein
VVDARDHHAVTGRKRVLTVIEVKSTEPESTASRSTVSV